MNPKTEARLLRQYYTAFDQLAAFYPRSEAERAKQEQLRQHLTSVKRKLERKGITINENI